MRPSGRAITPNQLVNFRHPREVNVKAIYNKMNGKAVKQSMFKNLVTLVSRR